MAVFKGGDQRHWRNRESFCDFGLICFEKIEECRKIAYDLVHREILGAYRAGSCREPRRGRRQHYRENRAIVHSAPSLGQTQCEIKTSS